jgi:hypothetical protein
MIFHSTSIRSRPHNAQDVRFAVMAALPDLGLDVIELDTIATGHLGIIAQHSRR